MRPHASGIGPACHAMDQTFPSSPTAPADDLLPAVLGHIAEAGIETALVRPPSRDGLGRLEVDLIVRPADRPRTESLLAADGFRRRPGWGRHPHHFHHRPVVSTADGTIDWLKIDLVTALHFGRHHELAGASAAALLDDRQRDVAGQRLARSDEFLALVLHELLDREDLRTAHQDRLVTLAKQAIAPGALSGTWGPEGGPAPTWLDVRQTVLDQDWATLDGQRAVFRTRLRRHEPLPVLGRSGWNRLARHAAKPLTALRARGPLVAVLGADGTGKSTLTSSLVEASGLPTRLLYGGTYPAGTPSSRVPGLTMVRVVARLSATRAAIHWHRSRGRLVVLDRHPVQVRPTPAQPLPTKTKLRRHLLAVTLPRPDLTVVLDAPLSVLSERRPEHPVALLAEDRTRHLALAETGSDALLDATLEPAALCGQVVRLVWERAMAPDRAHQVASHL